MNQINIAPEVAIKEAETLAEYWRNRSLGYAQLCYTQQIRIKELEDEKAGEIKVPVVKSEGAEDGN